MPVIVKSVSIDDHRLRAALKKVEADLSKQMPRAINVGVRKTRTTIRKDVGRNLGVRAAAVNDKVNSINATRTNWGAGVIISVKKFPLGVYKFFREKRGGSVYKSGGGLIRRQRSFFLGQKRNKFGGRAVFERTTDKAYPIRKAYGSSAYAYVKNKLGIIPSRRKLLRLSLIELRRLVKNDVK